LAGANATIEDVAKAAGVSRQTVSRVINGAASVSAKARAAVEQAIDELGYVPNLAARRMGGSRSYVLLALIERGSEGQLPLGEMLAAGLETCSARGYHMMFEQADALAGLAEADIGRRLAPVIGAVQPDGVIVLPPLDHSVTLLAALARRNVRAECLAERSEFGRRVPGLDEAAFAEVATRKLVELGHRQIGFVPGRRDPARSQRRIEGYRRTLAKVGSRAHRHFVASPPSGTAESLALARSWLTPTIRPTAIIAEEAETALAFAEATRELGRSVPRDLSVLALEDADPLAQARPPLSALRLPYGALFAQACERLILAGSEEAGAPPGEPFECIERASLAAAPRSV
jgi:LacI family transcriptional regulator